MTEAIPRFAHLFGPKPWPIFGFTGEQTNRALLLEPGDVRLAWATAGACPRGACRELAIDVVDGRPVNLARAVLLDHLVRRERLRGPGAAPG